jgi:RNAse (barnase) inhibitor barstar
MSEIELGTLLADPAQAGAYFVDSRDREALVEAGGALQFAVLPVDLRGCHDAEAAMREIADILRFPEWFGENLDALADCLSDLSWFPAEGYVLVLEHSSEWRAQETETLETVLEILNDTAERWAQDRVPFWAFLPVSTRELEAINE